MASTQGVKGDAGESFPLAAQIPLKDFNMPDFPPQASRLRELTLTADIKLDEYQALVQDRPLTQPPLPNLPPSITHLTLELFGLGFPGTPPFLSRLARALPNLKSLTMFSCLIDGLDDASRKDAEKFFETLPLLQELHFIDSFARPGFFQTIAGGFEARSRKDKTEESGQQGGLKVVNVSYTFRGHEDSDFLARVQGEELSALIVPGIVGASFDFVPAVVDELADQGAREDQAEQDQEKKAEPVQETLAQGILPFASDGRAPAALKKRFETLSTGGLVSLRVLNLAMWSLRPAEVGHAVYACAGGGAAGLVDLTISVLLEEGWVDHLIQGLGHRDVGAALEGIEIVGVPDKAQEEAEDWKSGLDLVKRADVERLSTTACPRLGKFGMSLLKVKSAPNVLFMNEDGVWKGP